MTVHPDFVRCLNTSTIRGQKLPLLEEIQIVAKAGYGAIEPWVSELDAFTSQGGKLSEIRSCLADHGLRVPNLIGFFPWLSPDATKRKEAVAEARRNLEMAAEIGCTGLAAPPMGITSQPSLDIFWAAERYHELLDMGREYSVVPILEFWGMSKSLGSLGEAVAIALESGHYDARILIDVFHMFKKGSPFNSLRRLQPQLIGLVHINDYPSQPARADLTDSHRVHPGDGIAPLRQLFKTLNRINYTGMLSIELFNPLYWQQDALTVARTSREKMDILIEEALRPDPVS